MLDFDWTTNESARLWKPPWENRCTKITTPSFVANIIATRFGINHTLVLIETIFSQLDFCIFDFAKIINVGVNFNFLLIWMAQRWWLSNSFSNTFNMMPANYILYHVIVIDPILFFFWNRKTYIGLQNEMHDYWFKRSSSLDGWTSQELMLLSLYQ